VLTSIGQWAAYLQRSDWLIGLPFCAVGLILALAGWRIWKVAVVVTFAIIGWILGTLVAGGNSQSLLYAVAGAVMLGAASAPTAPYSIAALGGIIVAGIAEITLSELGLASWPLWIALVLCFAGSTALSYIYMRQVIVIVTAFEGAVLLMSGAVAIVSETPRLFNFFRSISNHYWFFLPFLLLVPTVVGCLLQMADVKQRDSGMAG
jgi:hypothetical protein